ncbi:flagellar basal body-associated FliL family protein [Dyella psychrodurans]|uniref:Flagellar protein FliL n=1 Tax=Dyella psychrodurans TaxID=1927960 RepID=A0A370X0H0_9GAMM|nr:flagellar basal body-associated FliL family protein [Dyella psychrodurans]RDS81846.1 flagellar basal body protein FliL [Dyella psychrodurans]
MASAEDIQDEVSTVAKKRSNRMPLIIGVVVLLLLGAGGYMVMGQHTQKATADAAAPKAPELFVPLDPAFVVNFQDQDSTRYLQVGVTVMTHDPAAVQAVKDSDPVIRNALVMLFSSQTYAGLSDTAGKVKLQTQALQAVRKVVSDKIGKPDVDALYFTSFVMQ